VKPGSKADLPPIVFIHGASASLYDPMPPFRAKIEETATLCSSTAGLWLPSQVLTVTYFLFRA